MDDDDIVIIDDIGEILTEDIPPAPFIQQGPHKPKQRLNDSVTLFSGDCLETMRQFADNCMDAVVTDPPYELGFMGKKWDKNGISFQVDLWAEVFRILKPGGHIAVFGGDKTMHRMISAIEDAGFEIRRQLAWVYGQGFPKSRNISSDLKKSLPSHVLCACGLSDQGTTPDSQSDCQGDRDSCGESLHPEIVADPGVAPSLIDVHECTHGDQLVGALVAGQERTRFEHTGPPSNGDCSHLQEPLSEGCRSGGSTPSDTQVSKSHDESTVVRKRASDKSDTLSSGYDLALALSSGHPFLSKCRCGKIKVQEGIGTDLKPALELICLARKPLSEKTVAANVLMWGTGALNIEKCRVEARDGVPKFTHRREDSVNCYGDGKNGSNRTGEIDTTTGRWPTNLIHDGSPEVIEVFPESSTTGKRVDPTKGYNRVGNGIGPANDHNGSEYTDSGSAARFYPTCQFTDEDFETEIPIKQWLLYCAKATKKDRNGSKHPTIKPIKLMQWLCRLITPPGGCLLDPFAGSGTTGTAAVREGFQTILCENDPEYQDDICRRFSEIPIDDGDGFIMVNTDIILDETAGEGS